MDTSHPYEIYKSVLRCISNLTRQNQVLEVFRGPLLNDFEMASQIFLFIRKLQTREINASCIIEETLLSFPSVDKRFLTEFLMCYMLNYEGEDDRLCRVNDLETHGDDVESVLFLTDGFWRRVHFLDIPVNMVRYTINEYPNTFMVPRNSIIVDKIRKDFEKSVDVPVISSNCLNEFEPRLVSGRCYILDACHDITDCVYCILNRQHELVVSNGQFWILIEKVNEDVFYHITHDKLSTLINIYDDINGPKNFVQINLIWGSDMNVLEKLLNDLNKYRDVKIITNDWFVICKENLLLDI